MRAVALATACYVHIIAHAGLNLVIGISLFYRVAVSQSLGLPTPKVARLCGVPASTLANWVDRGLCTPSLAESFGRRRATQYWSIRDIVVVRVIRTLRTAGCPLGVIAKVADVLGEEWGSGLSDAVLWWDGIDVLTVTPAGDLVSLATQHGQGVFAELEVSVSCPVGVWESQLTRKLAGTPLIHVDAIQERRRKAADERSKKVDWGVSEGDAESRPA